MYIYIYICIPYLSPMYPLGTSTVSEVPALRFLSQNVAVPRDLGRDAAQALRAFLRLQLAALEPRPPARGPAKTWGKTWENSWKTIGK